MPAVVDYNDALWCVWDFVFACSHQCNEWVVYVMCRLEEDKLSEVWVWVCEWVSEWVRLCECGVWCWCVWGVGWCGMVVKVLVVSDVCVCVRECMSEWVSVCVIFVSGLSSIVLSWELSSACSNAESLLLFLLQ